MKFVQVFFVLVALSSLFACDNQKEPSKEQAVIVRFTYGSTDLNALHALEKELEKVLTGKSLGEYDGNSLSEDGEKDVLYFYGPDARQIFDAVKFILVKQPFMDGAEVTVQYGPADDEEQQEIFILKYTPVRTPTSSPLY